MTKADIVEHIYERVGFSKKESAELVEKVFEIIKETLADGEKVKISGFGNFVVGEKRAKGAQSPDRRGNPARRSKSSDIQAQPRAKKHPERRECASQREWR